MFHDLVKEDGLVYAMVPCEIHAGIARLGYDPVTHINFFTPNSFEALFRLADFKVVSSGADEMSNIWILASKRAEDDMGISDFLIMSRTFSCVFCVGLAFTIFLIETLFSFILYYKSGVFKSFELYSFKEDTFWGNIY